MSTADKAQERLDRTIDDHQRGTATKADVQAAAREVDRTHDKEKSAT
ncbi:hypothetical protein AB0L00_21090 [Actinoallomurus sp. NPDC052308]